MRAVISTAEKAIPGDGQCAGMGQRLEIGVPIFVAGHISVRIERFTPGAGYFRGVACCSSQRVASRYQSLKAVSGSMSARVSSAFAVMAGSAS